MYVCEMIFIFVFFLKKATIFFSAAWRNVLLCLFKKQIENSFFFFSGIAGTFS